MGAQLLVENNVFNSPFYFIRVVDITLIITAPLADVNLAVVTDLDSDLEGACSMAHMSLPQAPTRAFLTPC